jgi:hypothetical protein
MTYAIIDDKFNTANEQHAAKVSTTIEHFTGPIGEDIFNMPSSPSQEAAVLLGAISSTSAPAINCSWASTSNDHVAGLQHWWQSDAYEAQRQAWLSGKTLVFAAGNMSGGLVGGASAEASSPFTLTVSAMDKDANGHDELTSYSQAGPELTNYVTLGTAPWYAPDPSSVGTSFAAPRITAAVTLLQQRFGGQLSQSELHTILDEWSVGEALPKAGTPPYYPVQPSYIYHTFSDDEISAISSVQHTLGQLDLRAQVEGAYCLVLDRIADKAGLDWYTQQAQTNGLAWVGQQLRNSSEYSTVSQHQFSQVPTMEHVLAMYHDILGREADDAGAAWWANKIITEQPAPTLDQITTTGRVIDWHSYEVQFAAGGGVSLPSWLS